MPALKLQYPTLDDTRAIYDAVIESRAELAPWMEWCHPDYTEADTLMWIDATAEGRKNGTSYEFCIYDARNRFLGTCGINGVQKDQRLANLGYWIRTTKTGRGFAPEACRQLIDWTFANTPLHRLEIVAALANVKSQRVAEKLGAQREGVLRHRLVVKGEFEDAVIYSIINADEDRPC